MTNSCNQFIPVSGMKLVPIRGGITVAVPDSYDHITPYVLEEQQDWFEAETDFLRACAAPGMRMIDIGANFGVYSLIAASQIGRQGQVWSFEPTSATAAYLRQSLEANGFENVTVLQRALSDTARTARLKLEENSEMNRLMGDEPIGPSEEIRVLSLDQAVGDYGMTDIDFLKLDAEGEELRIIQGARKFWNDESPLIMFEFKHNDRVNTDLIEAFAALGFKLYRYCPGPGVLVPFAEDTPLDALWLNLFCCRDDRATSLEERGLLSTEPPDERMRPDGYAGTTDSDDPVAAMQAVIRLFERSNDRDYPASDRANALYCAFRMAQERFSRDLSLPELSTLARLADALGYHRRAHAYMIMARERLGSFQDPKCPAFLPADSRFDKVPSGHDAQDWFTAMIYVSIEKNQGHSSYYAPLETLKNLERIMSTGYVPDDMLRRLELIKKRIQARQQSGAPS